MTEPAPRKSDLGVRVVSAIVLLMIFGSALWLGGAFFIVVVGLFAAAALYEWVAIVRAIPMTAGARAAWIMAGIAYIGTACAGLLVFRRIGIPHAVLPIMATVCTDIGAYFAGRAIGGPKIAPRISPSKTWAGLVGGMVAAGLFVAWWNGHFAYHQQWTAGRAAAGFALGAGLAIIAQAGDFFESAMKRRAGVKDSGSLIPGHGGVLDRVDGMIAVLGACVIGWLAMGAIIE